MAGFPPFFGFIAKELSYKASEYAPILGTAVGRRRRWRRTR